MAAKKTDQSQLNRAALKLFSDPGEATTTGQVDALQRLSSSYTHCANDIIETLSPGIDRDQAIKYLQSSSLFSRQSVMNNAKNHGGTKLDQASASEIQFALDSQLDINKTLGESNERLSAENAKLKDYIELHVKPSEPEDTTKDNAEDSA